MRAALEVGAAMHQWKACAVRARNLSELELALGEVMTAVRDAEQSVTYADQSGDGFERATNRARLAYAQYQAGQRAKVEADFRDVEAMHAEQEPDTPLCYSMAGFLYCDVLLAGAERGPMPVVLADIHLYRARLFHGVTPYPWGADADGHVRGPKDDLAAARRLIEKHSYWRRKEELEDAERAAPRW